MTTPEDDQERAERIRRTRLVRRGVVAAGAAGALGAAVAIGATIQTPGAAAPGTTDRSPEDRPRYGHPQDDEDFDQPPQAGQLAGPSDGGEPQGHSGGS